MWYFLMLQIYPTQVGDMWVFFHKTSLKISLMCLGYPFHLVITIFAWICKLVGNISLFNAYINSADISLSKTNFSSEMPAILTIYVFLSMPLLLKFFCYFHNWHHTNVLLEHAHFLWKKFLEIFMWGQCVLWHK